jgi:hypothetical protein
MHIKDDSGILSAEELDQLCRFIQDHLLSSYKDRAWLGKIRVHSIHSDYDGTWDARIRLDSNDQIIELVAVISLNIYRFRGLDPQTRLSELMRVLAHEYGHHWTLIYLIASQRMTDYFNERLPAEYYRLRGLNDRNHSCNYSLGWLRCDKEIIAEDYRVLFAPHPCNQDHQMVEHPEMQIAAPNQSIAGYIQSLDQLV